MKKVVLLLVVVPFVLLAIDGRVTYVEGKVQVNNPDKDIIKWETAVVGTILKENYKIRTGKESYAEILFSSGTLIKVYPLTVIKIEDLYTSSIKKKDELSISLLTGNLRSKVNRIIKADSDYKVKTPVATMGVRGTDFVTSQIPGKESRVFVFEGKVEVKEHIANTKPVMVKKEEFAIVKKPDASKGKDIEEVNLIEVKPMPIVYKNYWTRGKKNFQTSRDYIMSLLAGPNINKKGILMGYNISAPLIGRITHSLYNYEFKTDKIKSLILGYIDNRRTHIWKFNIGFMGIGGYYNDRHDFKLTYIPIEAQYLLNLSIFDVINLYGGLGFSFNWTVLGNMPDIFGNIKYAGNIGAIATAGSEIFILKNFSIATEAFYRFYPAVYYYDNSFKNVSRELGKKNSLLNLSGFGINIEFRMYSF